MSRPSACTRATTRYCSSALHTLSASKGNTLVVVEHDEDTIRRAEHLIDIGPSAGKRARWPAGGRRHGVKDHGSGGSDSARPAAICVNAMRHPMQARRAIESEIAAESEAIKDGMGAGNRQK
jgi:excinuclease ABC subunit A